MTGVIKSATPEMFWELYSRQLNETGTYQDYHNDKMWTLRVLDVAKNVLGKDKGLGLETQREYFRIDLIGYTTKWSKEKHNNREKQQHDWELRVAYEHENSDKWDDELCKLCYIVADLRVISSYYDFRENEKTTIEIFLKHRIDTLGAEKIHRVPNSNWLFVFGPRSVCTEKPFRAFKIDEKLNIIPISGGEEVIPQLWRKKNKLTKICDLGKVPETNGTVMNKSMFLHQQVQPGQIVRRAVPAIHSKRA